MTHHLVLAYDLHKHFDMYVRNSSLSLTSAGTSCYSLTLVQPHVPCRSPESWRRRSSTPFIPRCAPDGKDDCFDAVFVQKVDCTMCIVQEFIDFLANSENEYSDYVYKELPEEHTGIKYGIDNDCPIFPGMWDFCRLYAGASVGKSLSTRFTSQVADLNTSSLCRWGKEVGNRAV